ncbi:hypothetical protein MPSI1_001276 [Malassezia psittaci]|uniref:Rhodanese domain-containing protein n=1 Tax=Malassezia psittaci TaxID=1821823 RepID=A0AAF0JDP8_9BASI|nr:hypothetical protein MPSI1_001276 [Malassezia psittaci]
MLPSPALSSSGAAMQHREPWMWPSLTMPNTAMSTHHAPAPLWEQPSSGERSGGSPSRYMMYRSDAEHMQFLAQQSQAQQAAASQFYAPPMFPYGMPIHPDVAQQMQRMNGVASTNGYAFMPIPGYPMLDQAQMPMMMQMPAMNHHPSYRFPADEKAHNVMSHAEDRREASFEEALDRYRSEEPDSRDHSMEELLALSRQAQMEAGGNSNVFVCPHCEKRYVGKHARSIWRRHLQDKHAIPLSVQPRRTRWDRDANRPRNAEERRERMLESKRRWARKKREQERRVASGGSRAESKNTGTETPVPEDIRTASPTPEIAPTPKRTALAPRDANVPTQQKNFTKSPAVKLVSPLPLSRSTPMRDWNTHSTPHQGEAAYEPSKRGTAAPASLSKRCDLDRAALAAFSRVDPSPRVFPSASKHESRLTYSDLQGSPIAPSLKRDNRTGDQFSSPQHLNLTHSLGLAPHSASRNGGNFGGMYSGVSMTPMQGGVTPYTKMPLGLTPTIGGLLRGDLASLPPSAGGPSFLHNAGDLSMSNYVMGYSGLDTPSIHMSRSARLRRHTNISGHSSSDRDEEEDLDNETDQRNASPSIRHRPRNHLPRPLAQETPSKMQASAHSIKLPTPRTPLGMPQVPWAQGWVCSSPRLCLDLRADFDQGHLKGAVHIARLDALKSRFSTLPKRGVPFLIVCDGDEFHRVAQAFVPAERWNILAIIGIDADKLPESPHPCYAMSLQALRSWGLSYSLWSEGEDDHANLLFSPAPVVERFLECWEPQQNETILDIGCGAGRDTTFILTRGRCRGAAWRATLLDRWRQALKRAELLMNDNNLVHGPGCHAEAFLPLNIMQDGQLQLDGHCTTLQQANLPQAYYTLIVMIRFWHIAFLYTLPSRTAPGSFVVLSHFVHEPNTFLDTKSKEYSDYDSPPPSARIHKHDFDKLIKSWNATQSWHIVDHRIESIEDGRPVFSVVLHRTQ